jgi:hypothetical protein
LDKISFTGSPGVGRLMAQSAGANLKPVTMELGGKSPNIVFDDADFDRALIGALAGRARPCSSIFQETGVIPSRRNSDAGTDAVSARPLTAQVMRQRMRR